jgi:hypothetical protein
MWVIGVFQVLVPILLIGVLAIHRKPNRLLWMLNTVAFGMVISFMWVSTRWDISSIYLRTLFPILFLVASVISYRRIRAPTSPLSKMQTFIGIVANGLLIVLMAGFNWFSFQGYSVPNGTVGLSSPLRGARFVVLHGGASPFTNVHFRVRPQNYALDILGLNVLGMRADIFGDRSDLESYSIFGAELYSPCTGRIAVAMDDYEDLVPPATDPEHPAGNHVLVECEGVEVLLAHLKRGSVTVEVGDSVTVETVLGQVGNTGNTSEPHLHIHAEQGGEPGVILDGRAVPITIDGRFLVRGDIIAER